VKRVRSDLCDLSVSHAARCTARHGDGSHATRRWIGALFFEGRRSSRAVVDPDHRG
jgi:hypothetical protein